MTEKTIFEEIDLRRDFFTTNAEIDNWNWFLGELGIPEEERSDIDEITVTIDGYKHE